MENDLKHMRFLASCFALIVAESPKNAVEIADELLQELENEKTIDSGIATVVPKRKRSRNNSGDNK